MSILNRIVFLGFFISCAHFNALASESEADDDGVISAYVAWNKVKDLEINPADLTRAEDAIANRGNGTVEQYVIVGVHAKSKSSAVSALWDMAAWVCVGATKMINYEEVSFDFGEDRIPVVTSLLKRAAGEATEDAVKAFDALFLEALLKVDLGEARAKFCEEYFSKGSEKK